MSKNNTASAAVAARIAPVVRRAAAPVSGFEAAPVSAPVAAPVSAPAMSQEDLIREFMALKAQNEALRAKVEAQNVKKERPVTFKISRKGVISIYGLGRFPLNVYPNQARRLGKAMPDILKFIDDNDGKPVSGVDKETGEPWTITFHAERGEE